MDETRLSRYLDALEEDGYCIIENAIEPSLIEEVRTSVARLENDLNIQPRGNRAEGFATKRMYNLLDLALGPLREENEKNALLCLRIIFDLHRNFRPSMEKNAVHFLKFVLEVYEDASETLQLR